MFYKSFKTITPKKAAQGCSWMGFSITKTLGFDAVGGREGITANKVVTLKEG